MGSNQLNTKFASQFYEKQTRIIQRRLPEKALMQPETHGGVVIKGYENVDWTYGIREMAGSQLSTQVD